MLQLYLQEIQVWLDIDDLEGVDQLEESVNVSAVFILFYTEGYFTSENYRREVYAEIEAEKLIVIVYVDVNKSNYEKMRTHRECA